MNWVDIVIIVLAVGLGFLGWRNGLIRWAFTLIGGIIGVVLAGRFYTTLAPVVPLDSEGMQQVSAFAAIFLGIIVGSWILARTLKAVLNVLMLGWVDHAAGLALGLAAGAMAATAVIAAMGIVPSDTLQSAVTESTLAGPMVEYVGVVLALLPSEFSAVRNLFD